MLVKVISPFKLKGKIAAAGVLINIPTQALPKLRGRVEPVNPEAMQAEYMDLLGRYWKLRANDSHLSMDEVRQLMCRLDGLFRALHHLGRKAPIRLPVERHLPVTPFEAAQEAK